MKIQSTILILFLGIICYSQNKIIGYLDNDVNKDYIVYDTKSNNKIYLYKNGKFKFTKDIPSFDSFFDDYDEDTSSFFINTNNKKGEIILGAERGASLKVSTILYFKYIPSVNNWLLYKEENSEIQFKNRIPAINIKYYPYSLGIDGQKYPANKKMYLKASSRMQNKFITLLILFNINVYSQTFNELKKDTANFVHIKVDLNKDKVLDDVFNSKRAYGDKLFFFINKKKVLETRNLSEDGGFAIKNIIPITTGGVLKIETYFPDRGNLGAVHYIDFKNKQWILTKTMYYINYWDEKAIECKCWVNQNILLKELNKPEVMIEWFPSEDERKKKCSFRYPRY